MPFPALGFIMCPVVAVVAAVAVAVTAAAVVAAALLALWSFFRCRNYGHPVVEWL